MQNLIQASSIVLFFMAAVLIVFAAMAWRPGKRNPDALTIEWLQLDREVKITDPQYANERTENILRKAAWNSIYWLRKGHIIEFVRPPLSMGGTFYDVDPNYCLKLAEMVTLAKELLKPGQHLVTPYLIRDGIHSYFPAVNSNGVILLEPAYTLGLFAQDCMVVTRPMPSSIMPEEPRRIPVQVIAAAVA